jgi:hypothetical protein
MTEDDKCMAFFLDEDDRERWCQLPVGHDDWHRDGSVTWGLNMWDELASKWVGPLDAPR